MKSLLLFLLGYRISTWCLMKFNFTFNTCEIRMIMGFFSSRISIPWDKLMSGWNTNFIRVSFQIHNDWRMYMFVCTCVWVYVNVCVYLYIACACVFCVCMFHVCMYVYCVCRHLRMFVALRLQHLSEFIWPANWLNNFCSVFTVCTLKLWSSADLYIHLNQYCGMFPNLS